MIHAGYEQVAIIAEKKQHTCNPQTWVRFMFVCLVVDVVLGFFFFWGGGAMSLSSFQYKSPKNLLHFLSDYYFVIKKKLHEFKLLVLYIFCSNN